MKDTTTAARELLPKSNVPGPRIAREKATIRAMMQLFCNDHHTPAAGLCRDCEGLLTYALRRLEICPFQEKKPACSRCKVHCYSAEQRERVKAVMRYAGPRMLLRHPILSVLHLLDKRSPVPEIAPHQKR